MFASCCLYFHSPIPTYMFGYAQLIDVLAADTIVCMYCTYMYILGLEAGGTTWTTSIFIITYVYNGKWSLFVCLSVCSFSYVLYMIMQPANECIYACFVFVLVCECNTKHHGRPVGYILAVYLHIASYKSSF